MTKLPRSLSIALWLVGATWLVGLLGYLLADFILAVLVMGLIAAAAEWKG